MSFYMRCAARTLRVAGAKTPLAQARAASCSAAAVPVSTALTLTAARRSAACGARGGMLAPHCPSRMAAVLSSVSSDSSSSHRRGFAGYSGRKRPVKRAEQQSEWAPASRREEEPVQQDVPKWLQQRDDDPEEPNQLAALRDAGLRRHLVSTCAPRPPPKAPLRPPLVARGRGRQTEAATTPPPPCRAAGRPRRWGPERRVAFAALCDRLPRHGHGRLPGRRWDWRRAASSGHRAHGVPTHPSPWLPHPAVHAVQDAER